MSTTCRDLSARGVCWSIENPTNSLTWQYPSLRDLIADTHEATFDACMHGSHRKKKTSIWANRSWFLPLRRQCDGAHDHLPWGKARAGGRTVWSTALESAYPKELAVAWAQCAAEACFGPQRPPPAKHQRKRATFEPPWPTPSSVGRTGHSLPGSGPPCLPKGAKLLRFYWDPPQAVIRVPRDPLTWCKLAQGLAHPSREHPPLAPNLQAAIQFECEHSAHHVAQHRTTRLAQLNALRRSLHALESAARGALDATVQAVTRTKQTCLLRALLERHGYPDARVADEIREGFPLTGWLAPSGIWETQVVPPTLPDTALRDTAPLISADSVRKVTKQPDAEIRQALWEATTAEAAQGWLTLHPLSPALLASNVVSVRFGVTQKNKVRPIDNFRGSHINAACGTSEKVSVDGPNLIAQACLAYIDQHTIRNPEDRLVGRTWDLKSAYKQLAVRPDHRHFAWIAAQDLSTGEVQLAQMHSMPFGAVASVHAFLRCSEALKFLAREHLFLVVTSYFDDFTVLTTKRSAAHATLVVETFFRMLGWTLSPEEKKNPPFAEVFDTLGVRFDLTQQSSGTISIGNTPGRVQELQDALQAVLDSDTLSYEWAQRLRGRLIFAEQQLWGRNGRQATIAVGSQPPDTPLGAPLGLAQRRAIEFILARVLTKPAKTLSHQSQSPAYLWLDGSCEWDVHDSAPTCGLGAVLLADDRWETWGAQLPPAVCGLWARRAGKSQLIFEAELLPYLVSLHVWYERLKQHDVWVFIDNDGARAALSKAFSGRPEGAQIIHDAINLEEELGINAAFFRVPTSSNIADGPSRDHWDETTRLGARRTQVPLALLRAALHLNE